MPIKLITQLQNTSVTNNVVKVTKVYAVFKTDAYYLNMVECANVYVHVRYIAEKLWAWRQFELVQAASVLHPWRR